MILIYPLSLLHRLKLKARSTIIFSSLDISLPHNKNKNKNNRNRNHNNKKKKMEDLIAQFSFLSNQALQDKSFDPATIEDLMKLFEIEAYKSWAAVELEQQQEVEAAEVAMQEAEDYMDSVMESAMDEFRRFEAEMEAISKAELDSLVATAESARKMGKFMENAATIASKRYIEAALNSATASMKSAWKGISTSKVHPS